MAGREQAACLTAILYDYQEEKKTIIFLIPVVVNVLLLLLKFTKIKLQNIFQVLFSNTFKSTAFSDWIQQTNAKTNCVLVKKESKLIIILNIDFILSPLVFDLASERFL